MNCGKVYLFDEIVGDEISSNLVITCRILDLLFGHGVTIESFHAYFNSSKCFLSKDFTKLAIS